MNAPPERKFRKLVNLQVINLINSEAEEKERPRPLKGILKRSIVEISRMRQREIEEKYRRDHEAKIDPNFLHIINDISANKGIYPMEKVEEMLKPYK